MKINIDIDELENISEILKVMAHPIRLCIVKGLIDNGPCNVSNMQECFQIPQPTVSSHLGKLKRAGILESTREGTEIYYRVESQFIKDIIYSVFSKSA
ncbi:MAG: metalloregulator ArsR/SmtB family transcription factor [Tissierellia bacterium]|nr:metalloregulator ArsR/SmtB family transcription factor [Tissierellia bacterium]